MVSSIKIPLKSTKNEGLSTLNQFPMNYGYENQKQTDMQMFFEILRKRVGERKLKEEDLMSQGTRLILDVRPLSRNSDLDNTQFILKSILDTLESTYVSIEDGIVTDIQFVDAHKGSKQKILDRPFLNNDNIKNISSIFTFYSGNSTLGYPYCNIYYTNDSDEYVQLLNYAVKANIGICDKEFNMEKINDMIYHKEVH